MGGQEFATDSICIDTRSLDRVISFDHERGLIEAEAGIQWSKLIRSYLDAQASKPKQWGIAQKQTGADTFTLGGSLSSNIHGRGLAMKPLISNIESFTLINAEGKAIRCSRDENNELFRLAIGGYGLFGLINRVTLRLVPRQRLRRVVEIIRADNLPKRFEERIAERFLYGDFQFTHVPYTEWHRSVAAFVPRINRFGDSARRKLLPDLSQIREARASHDVLSAVQRISGPETKV